MFDQVGKSAANINIYTDTRYGTSMPSSINNHVRRCLDHSVFIHIHMYLYQI